MTTRHSQLRQEVESLTEENQRLNKLVQQQKAGVSPTEKARTPLAKESERQTPQDLGEALPSSEGGSSSCKRHRWFERS